MFWLIEWIKYIYELNKYKLGVDYYISDYFININK